jgi:hypothetical protein
MMKKFLGILILLGIAGAIIVFTATDWGNLQRDKAKDYQWVDINLFYGGEKSQFLKNPDIQKQLEKYKIRLHASKAGSIEMVSQLDTKGKDCLWPSNQIGVELAKQQGKTVLSSTNIFNSAMVFYTWKPVTEALIKAGVAQRKGKITHLDTQKLIQLAQTKKHWKNDLNLDIYGSVKIFSTDPKKSNSGNMWAALLANMLNNGTVVSDASLVNVLPEVQAYFRSMGYMESSSGDIFENFLKQGMGARPIIVGYENQLIEFLIEHQEYQDIIRKKIDIIYPTPTIFASHPLISLTESCQRLDTALQDPTLQQIAWQAHGFRSGLINVENNPEDLGLDTIAETVTQVIPMPSANVMQAIIRALN